MPDVDDAIALITDPENLSDAGDRRTGMRAVNEHRVVDALRGGGAGRGEARTLARDAVRAVGGRIESTVQPGGRNTSQVVESWLVPAAKVDSD
jgi:hypothetical protein